MSVEIGNGRVALQGAIGGMAGGMVMGATSMMAFPLLGAGGFFTPLALIAGAAHASWAASTGFALVPVMVGMGIHMITSAMLGASLALAARATGKAWLAWALGGALAAWVGAQFVVLPVVDPALVASFPPALFAVAHVMYGLALGGWLWLALGEHEALGAAHSRA